MKQHFTQDDLVKYIYKETSMYESLAISEALIADPVLRMEYEELLESYRELPKVTFSPSAQTIDKVLAYSERQAALETTL
ncbi:MAG: hypothetical protein AAGH79_00030 [Bacteroidota bacterium]